VLAVVVLGPVSASCCRAWTKSVPALHAWTMSYYPLPRYVLGPCVPATAQRAWTMCTRYRAACLDHVYSLPRYVLGPCVPATALRAWARSVP